MSKELIERLRILSDSRKPYQNGATGQMVGMESYRVVANGFALSCIDEAADRIEAIERERDALQADNARLRELVIWMSGCGYDFKQHEFWLNNSSALASTPEQSLARIRNQVREECAKQVDAYHDYGVPMIDTIAAAIRATKEPE